MSTQSTTSGEAVHALRGFTELGKADVDFAGGKGANLGELTRAGLPVPPGFVIGAPAYVAFCEAQGLRDRIAAELRELDVDDTAALVEASTRVREMILAEPLPGWLESAIRDAYDELTGDDHAVAVAVRSSATAARRRPYTPNMPNFWCAAALTPSRSTWTWSTAPDDSSPPRRLV